MTTKELIEAEIEHLDEAQLNQLYQVARRLSESKKPPATPSLMGKLKQVKIDGPEDFATNLELYLSGEKRVE